MAVANDGGPAFPGYTMHDDGDKVQITKLNPGMTLRDYFAAAAMQGWLTTYGVEASHPASHPTSGYQHALALAKYCYATADAMLAVRNKPAAGQ
jgi:hypothetical protein